MDGYEQEMAVLLGQVREGPGVDRERLARVRVLGARAYAAAGSPRVAWRVTRALAGIAAVVAVAMLVMAGGGREEYAWAQVPAAIEKARTLHWRQRVEYPSGTVVETERWVDVAAGRTRGELIDRRQQDGRMVERRNRSIFDGQSILYVDDEAKLVRRYTAHRSPAAAALNAAELRVQLARVTRIDGVGKATNFKKTGKERVNGREADVWEGTVPAEGRDARDRLVKVWVAANGAADLRLLKSRSEEMQDGQERPLVEQVEVLGQDEALAESLFSTSTAGIPEDYAGLLGPAGVIDRHVEAATVSGGAALMPAFELPGGAVVIGWRETSDEGGGAEWKDGAAPARLAGLTFGTKLPVHEGDAEVRAVLGGAVAGMGFDARFLGVVKGPLGAQWVWCVFIPRQEVSEEHVRQYRIKVGLQDWPLGDRVPVADGEAFAKLVRATMEDWGGKVDGAMTYEAVMKLGRQRP
jgi:hypothetical protein